GMRDFGPKEMLIREWVVEKIEEKFKLYGFRPLDTPAMEFLDVLTAKSGEEIKQQIFRIKGEEIGLRFDLTVPLARFVASNLEIPKPFKRYAIAKVWRNEEAQKGRYREFMQADADIVGTKSMRAEGELLNLTYDVLKGLGFELKNAKFLLNNRKILNGLAESWGIDEKKREDVFRSLDKMDKIGENGVRKELEGKVGRKKTEEILESLKVGGKNREKLEFAARYSKEGARELEEILTYFPKAEVDLFLVRGLAYYTGPIFEVKLSEEIGSVAAGGRYDGLIGLYGSGEYATGISFGVERLIYLINKRGEENARETTTKIFVANVKPEFYPYALKIAEELRKAGICTEVDLNDRNLRKQFEYANALKIPYVAIVGEKEKKEGKITLRSMESGKEEFSSLNECIKKLKTMVEQ
ncbi:MAG: histidine--tRNA ligase, partial [Candidatus Anstonellales archaeon]